MLSFSSYASFHSSWPIRQSYFNLSYVVYKIINVDQNNKLVYYFFVNVTNVYYICCSLHPRFRRLAVGLQHAGVVLLSVFLKNKMDSKQQLIT